MIRDSSVLFDQHFLIDGNIQDRMLHEAYLSKNDVVIEIGPGKGVLSAVIAKRVKRLICVEIDTSMRFFLTQLQHTYSNISVIYGNVLNMELPSCTKILSNLPFSIIEPFMEKLIGCEFEQAVFIVGNRFASGVAKAQTNRLSLLTNCFFTCEIIAEIHPTSFSPPPRVRSALIRLKKKRTEEVWLRLHYVNMVAVQNLCYKTKNTPEKISGHYQDIMVLCFVKKGG